MVIEPGTCPVCSARLEESWADEPALFSHGGYGETRRTVRRTCQCGFWLTSMIGAVRP